MNIGGGGALPVCALKTEPDRKWFLTCGAAPQLPKLHTFKIKAHKSILNVMMRVSGSDTPVGPQHDATSGPRGFVGNLAVVTQRHDGVQVSDHTAAEEERGRRLKAQGGAWRVRGGA